MYRLSFLTIFAKSLIRRIMEGILNENSILSWSDEDFEDLFGDNEDSKSPADDNADVNSENDKETAEESDDTIDAENLFGDDESDSSESVSSGSKDNKDSEETSSEQDDGTSPNDFNVYSSFAKALKDDSLFQNLDEDTVNNIKDAEGFADAMQKEIDARLDATVKRVNDALNNGVPANVIHQYENALKYLDSITEDKLKAMDDEGEKLRHNIIYQDYVNRGFSPEKANKEVKKSFDAGTDIEDAKDALEGTKNFFEKQYDALRQDAENQVKAERARIQEQTKMFQKAMLEDKEVFKGISLDSKTRRQAYEVMTKPVDKDADGVERTAIQKFADENPVEFRKALGVLYTLTNGFTSMDGLLQKQVNKKVKSHLSELENKISNRRTFNGGLSFAEGNWDNDDKPSKQGWRLDV